MSTLDTGIAAFWQLGSTADSVASSTLTNNASVSFANDGPVVGLKCATFDGTNYLSAISSAALATNGSLTLAGWFFLPTKTSTEILIAKRANAGAIDYRCYFNGASDDTIRFSVATSPAVSADTSGFSVNTWHSFIGVYDSVAQFRCGLTTLIQQGQPVT